MHIVFFQDKPLEPFGLLRHLATTRTSALPLVEVLSLLLPESSFFVVPFHRKTEKIYEEERLLCQVACLEYPEFFDAQLFWSKKKTENAENDFVLLNARHTSDFSALKKTIDAIKNLSVGQVLVQEKTWIAGKFSFHLLQKDLDFSAMDFLAQKGNQNLDVPPKCFDAAWECLLYGQHFSTSLPQKLASNLAEQNILRAQKGDLNFFSDENGEKNDGVWCAHETQSLIHPSVVFLDASKKNPIVLEKGVKIGPFSVIKAPFYAGVGAEIKPHTQIGVSAVGKKTKVGGEVYSSIIDDYSNKSHDGFMGHSVLGSWINVGAGTQFSNLKNLYSVFPLRGKNVASREKIPQNTHASQMVFAGALVGDLVRIAVNANIPCASILRVGATLNHGFPLKKSGTSPDDCHSDALLKHLPHFYWNDKRFYHSFWMTSEPNQYKVIYLEAILHIQKMMFERRDCLHTPTHQRLLRLVYERFVGFLPEKNAQAWRDFSE